MNEFLVRLMLRLDTGRMPADIKKLEKQLNKEGIRLKTVPDSSANRKEVQRLAAQLQSALQVQGISIDTEGLTAAIREVMQEMNSLSLETSKKITSSAASAAQGLEHFASALDHAADRMNSAAKKTSEASNGSNSSDSSGKDGNAEIISAIVETLSKGAGSDLVNLPELSDLAKSGMTAVAELDAAMTELGDNTSMSSGELEKFYEIANDVAQQTGVATKDLIEQADAWEDLGFSGADAVSRLTGYAAMFSAISPGLDFGDAAKTLASVMEAFRIGLTNPDDVVDGILSKVSAAGNAGTSKSSDIAAFLAPSSSALASAGNSIEESIAMGNTIIGITEDAKGAADALGAVSRKIRGYDEDLGTYTADLGKLKLELAALTRTADNPDGISLFSDSTETAGKSTYRLLEDISEIWDSLSAKNQTALLEALAGSGNGNALAALIKNFDSARESMDRMAGSAGLADREMSAASDSLGCKLNRLSETGTSIARNVFPREDLKKAADALTSVMNIIDKLTSKLGSVGSIGLGAGLFASLKNTGKRRMSVRIL